MIQQHSNKITQVRHVLWPEERSDQLPGDKSFTSRKDLDATTRVAKMLAALRLFFALVGVVSSLTIAEVGLELAWARYHSPYTKNAVSTKLFLKIDPNDVRSSDGKVDPDDLADDTRAVAVHTGPWDLIVERRTLGNIRNGVGVQVSTTTGTYGKKWMTTLGPGSQGIEELSEGKLVGLELLEKPDSGA